MHPFKNWKKACLKMSRSMKIAAKNISYANKYMLEKAIKAKRSEKM